MFGDQRKAEANANNGIQQESNAQVAHRRSRCPRAAARSAASARSSAPTVTGTGSMTVPIATSPGRSGFGPQLSLSYDSGAGNGPFGFGWSLSLPAITRKTDKGLPRTTTPTSPTSSSSPAPRTWCRSSSQTAMARGSADHEPSRGRCDYRSTATARASKACSPGSSAGPRERRRHPLALDLQGQHHDLVRQDRRELAIADPTRSRRASSAG